MASASSQAGRERGLNVYVRVGRVCDVFCVSQVGSMELCVRVVNARDGGVQTLAKIDPSNSSQYKYPSMVG